MTIFAAVDHCSADCIGIHGIKRAHRCEALELIRQAIREQFGSISAGVAAGVRLRHHHGNVYMSDDFQAEVAFPRDGIFAGLGPAVRGYRVHRVVPPHAQRTTLWVRRFPNLDELRAALAEFQRRYNERWILERLHYRTPAPARRDFSLELGQAA